MLEIADVLNSRTYVKDDSSVSFQSPRMLIQPFLDIVQTDRIIVKVQDPVINQNEDQTANVAYARVLVEAKVGSEVAGYDSTIGFLYALDGGSPKVKVFSGQNAHACTNLTIFNAEHVYEQSILGSISNAYNKAKSYLEQKAKEIAEFLTIKEELINTFYDRTALENELGRLLLLTTGNKNIGYPSSGVSQAAKWLQDKNSIYHVKYGEACSKLNLYDSLTQSITNSTDLLKIPNKTIAVSRLLSIN